MNVSLTPIQTYVTGTALSCGFMIAIHGHKRFCYENSTLMYHQVSSGTIGKVKDMEESIIESKRLQTMIEKMTIQKTRIPVATIEEIYKTKRNLYLDAEEAMELGCVDEIIYAARLPSDRVEETQQTEEQAHPHADAPVPTTKRKAKTRK
jgi:ATP-dependent Clp protease protease subunit